MVLVSNCEHVKKFFFVSFSFFFFFFEARALAKVSLSNLRTFEHKIPPSKSKYACAH